MSKRLLKKIILGSVLTSAVVSSTAIFSINASKQNFANQNKNTSSFKDIYTQKGAPSTASVNKLTPAPNALTNKANSNKWNQQMTPYDTKVKKPVITFAGFKEPSSPTAADGEAYYEIKNYNATYMFWSLFTKNTTHSDTFNRSSMGHTATLATVKNLKYGDNFKFYFYPKKGYVWDDGTTNNVEDSSFRLIGKQAKKPTIHYSWFKEPSSPTAADGEAYYEIKNYNATYMFWSLYTKTVPNSDTFNRSSMGHTATLATVKNLKYNDEFKFYFYLKKGYVWDDGTTNNVEDSSFRLIYKTPNIIFMQPQITQTSSKQPTTVNSSDGEVTYTLTGFDPRRMTMTLAPGSSGTLGQFNSTNKTVKVTGLKSGQTGKIQIGLKSPQIDSNFKKTIPAIGVDDDSTNLSGMHPSTVDKRVTIPLGSAAQQVSVLHFSTALKSWKSSDINPTLPNILGNANYSKDIYGSIIWDEDKNWWSYNGKSIESKANAAEFILDTQNSNGNASQIKLQIWVDSWNPQSREVFVHYTLTISRNNTGEDNGAMTDLIWRRRGAIYSWYGDNTKPIQSSPFLTRFPKTTFTKVVTQPKTTTSTDGEVTYTLTNFNPSNMNLSLVSGSSGTLGKYDPTTKQVKVTGLKVGQHAQIQVALLNASDSWIGSTITPQKSSTFTPSQTYVGIIKPTFTKVVTQPKTTTSTDGEVTYTLTNFNPSNMNLSLVSGSSGTLGKYDPTTKQVKVTGLKVGQHAQIQAILKTNEFWVDGINTPQKSSTFTPAQTYVGFTKPTFTNTSHNEFAEFQITGFDSTKMDVSVAVGSAGNLGTYDAKTKKIKILNLAVGQHAKISITPKAGQFWKDGTTSPVLSIPVAFFDVTTIKWTPAAPLSGTTIAPDWKEQTLNQQGLKFVYAFSIQNGHFKDKATFLSEYKKAKTNLWHLSKTAISNSYLEHDSIFVKIVSTGVVTARTWVHKMPLSTLRRVINISEVKAGIGDFAKTHIHIAASPISNSEKIIWDSIADLQTYASNNDLVVKFIITHSATTPNSNVSGWSSTLPTTANFTASKRHLFVKFSTKPNLPNTVAMTPVIIEITNSNLSSETHVKSAVNVSGINLRGITATGNTKNFSLSNLPNIPTGAILKFSYDNGATWADQAQFLSFVKSNPSKNSRTKFKVRLVESDKNKFYLTNGSGIRMDQFGNFDITQLFFYRDISALKTSLSGTGGIELSGQLSSPNGVQVRIVDQKLLPSKLDVLGLKMQYSLSAGVWLDLPSLSNITQNTAVGLNGGPNSFLLTINKQPVGNPFIKFRIIPFKDDLGVAKKVASNSDYNQWVNATMVHLSDFIIGNNSIASIAVDKGKEAAALPTLVSTISGDLSGISLSGDTRHLGISTTISNGKTAAQSVSASNGGHVFGSIKVTYGITINNRTIFFEREDFIAWMNGVLVKDITKKKVNNSAGQVIKVWYNTDEKQKDLQLSDWRPVWNLLKLTDFKASWNSTDPLFRATDRKIVNIPPSSVKKWVDLTSYEKKLEALQIKGQTNNLSSPDFMNIKNQLDTDFGSGVFVIKATNNLSILGGSSAKWQSSNISTNALPSEINFDGNLGFRIELGTAAGTGFVASHESDISATYVDVTWNKSTFSKIKKFIHTNKNDLATGVKLSGNTHTLASNISPEITHSTKFGVMDAKGVVQGLKVYWQLVGLTGVNSDAMPWLVFKDWLGGKIHLKAGSTTELVDSRGDDVKKYGFTPKNFKLKFDGTWGVDNIRVKYEVISSFVIAKGQDSPVSLSVASRNQVARYVDLNPVITAAKKIQVKGDASLGSWWNETTGDYDADPNNFGGYIDNKKLKWAIPQGAFDSKLKVKIQYSLDKNVWTDQPPTSTVDAKASRNIYIKYVADGTSYPNENGVVLSDTKVHDITQYSKIRNVLTYVDIKNADLTKVKIVGLTNKISKIETAAANIPTHSQLRLSISGFQAIDWNNASSKIINIITALKKAGFTDQQFLGTKFKPSMTTTEFIAWINQLKTNHPGVQIKRSWIQLRVFADPGYSIRQAETNSKKTDTGATPAIVDKLYTHQDVTSLKDQITFNNSSKNAIGLFGQQSVNDGVAVSIPLALTEKELLKKGLKLQYTLDTPDGKVVATNAEWIDSITRKIPKDTKVGQPADIPSGFTITVTPKSQKQSYLGFRLVPIQDDLGNTIANDMNTSNGKKTNHTVGWYQDDRHKKLFINDTTTMPTSIKVDTSQIPTVINVEVADLASIKISGDSKRIVIYEDEDGFGPGLKPITDKADAHNADQTLSDKLIANYSLDYTDGSPLQKNASNKILQSTSKAPVWLDKTSFTAYLDGKLIVDSSGKSINNVNTGKKISMKDSDQSTWISSRKAKPGVAILPIYDDIEIQNVFTKWNSIDHLYIPSDQNEWNIDITANPPTNKFRKWIDGNKFVEALKHVKVTGTTKSSSDYQIDINNSNNKLKPLQSSNLSKLKLKLEYSNDRQTWSDTKFDYLTLSYAKQKARKMYMRVVPQAFVPGSSDPAITDKKTDDLIIDYTNYNTSTVNSNYAELITVSKTNNIRDFKFFIDINKSELSAIKIKGTSLKIIGDELGIEDTTVDSNTGKYGDVTIKYLYNGKWVIKTDLIAELQKLQDAFKFHTPGQPWPTTPADFSHATVKARWFVDDEQTAVMKMGQLDPMEVDKTLFKTWVNIWDLQKKVKNTYTNLAGSKTMEFSDLVGGLGVDYDLSGTINKVGMSRKGGISDASVNSHSVVIQFTTKEFPDNSRNSKDWKPVSSLQNVVHNQALNPKHKSLYIRFVGLQDVVASTQDSPNWGNGTDILPIRIDISTLKYEIGVHSNDLTTAMVSGDTQSLFTSTADDVFLKGSFPIENGSAKSGIRYMTVDENGVEQAVLPKNRAAWIQDVGLTVQFKATATRNKGKYKINKSYEFNSYTEFLQALKDPAHRFNFDRSTLQLSWGVKPSKSKGYQVSDPKWVSPIDVSKVINVIYTSDFTILTNQSIHLSGNTILMNAQNKDAKLNNLPSGIKLQYTTSAPVNGALDPSAIWVDTLPKTLPEHKHIWMRFAVTDKNNYKLGADTGAQDAAQVTLLLTTQVKTAISLDQAWMDQFKSSSVTGKTYDIKWNNPIAVVPNSANGTKNGHVEFTVDGKLWYRALLATPKTPANITAAVTDFFNKSVASLIKDAHKLQIRYVIDKPALFEFTDPQGKKRPDKTLTKKIDISGLIEPIIIDQHDNNLPISSGSLHMTWKQFVASGKFKPSFVAGTLPKTASLVSMQFDGNDVDKKKHSFYKLDVNKFNPKDIQTRDVWNALAPRHAHFEFRTTNIDPKLNPNVNTWSAWSKTPPVNTKTSTIFKGFEIKLVADAGYEIPSTSSTTPIAAQFGDQRFSSKYFVIIEKDVNGITSGKVEFIGFHDTKSPSGTILTDNPNGNFAAKSGEPQIQILNKAGKELSTNDWKAFVLEYNVKRNGVDVSWTDTANSTKVGWHEFAMAPDSSVPWYGNYPKSLLNGDVIQYRLRARDGYLLLDNDSSLNRFRDKLGYVRKSHILGFTNVKKLKIAINIPPNTHIYNRDSLVDYWAVTITDDIKMPAIKFGGNEGTGTVSFDMRGFAARNQVDIEVQVLYLILGVKNQVHSMNVHQNPDDGYYVIDDKGQKHDVFHKKARGGTAAGWIPDSELIPGTWVSPSKVKTLSVGDAIRVRFKAKPGFAFKWEDPKTPFTDILYPKSFSKPTYGMNSSSPLVPGIKGITPIPVRGLTVLPPTTPQKVTMVLSKELDKMLNRSALFTMSKNPASNDKWKWSFTIIKKNGSVSRPLDAIPLDLSNGDQVRVTIKTINSSYKLEKNFALALKPRTFTVQGLKDAIWVDQVAVPKMVFTGRVGRGSISRVVEASNHGERFDRSGSGLAKPVLPFDKRSGNKGVKWEFQIANSNPKNLSERELALLTWSDVPPTTLNPGQFIRMRLAPNDPTEVALKGETATKKEILYSDDTIMVNGKPVKHKYGIGWVKIAGLKLNLEKIKLQHSVVGYKGKSTLQLSTLGQTLDDEGVELEASYDGGKTWHDPSFFKALDNTIFDPQTKKILSNFLIFRAYAKPGYIIDPNDSDPAKGITVTIDPVTKKAYLYKDEWDKVKISGLKLFLNVSRLSISPIIQTGKYDGRGSFKVPTILGRNTVVDKDGHKVDANGTPYTKFLKLRYVVRKIDPDTGEPLPSYIISDANQPPTGLYNGDSILVEIFVDEDNDPSTESEYRLSNNQTSSITISGLIMKIPHVDKPIISFIGDKSGEGSPNVSPKAPSRTMWQYARVPKSNDKFVAPDPKTIKWLNQKPTDLFVGEHIMVRLVSSINQKEVIDSLTGKTVHSDWVRVSGLKETLDLSKLVIRAIDTNNPQDPRMDESQKIAFKIQGKKTGSASVVLNKTLSDLLDVNGQKIPTPDALVWEFAVIDNVSADDSSYNQQRKNWSTAMPKNIKNNQRIWARLVIKDGPKYQNYKVVGFNEVSFVVSGLETSAKIESKTALLVAMITGVVATIGLGATIILIIKMRKRIKL